jgi:hypothetical protein
MYSATRGGMNIALQKIKGRDKPLSVFICCYPILSQISSLDKIEGDSALEQNRPWVETWGYEHSSDYPREH